LWFWLRVKPEKSGGVAEFRRSKPEEAGEKSLKKPLFRLLISAIFYDIIKRIMLQRPVLILNSSYEVLNVTNLKRGLKLLLSGKAEVVKADGVLVHGGQTSFPAPSILKLRYFVSIPYHPLPLNRRNVMFRDNFTCQYCGKRSLTGMTIDHIIPRSLGGKTAWDNVVCACKSCNEKKGDLRPQDRRMKLLKNPGQPVYSPLFRACLENFPPEWASYLAPVRQENNQGS